MIGSITHQQCWNRACDCFATAKIFERRAQRLRGNIDWLSYLGIGVPSVFGAMVLAWGNSILSNPALMFIVGALGVIQVGVSVTSIVKKWPDELAYANRSAAANFELSDQFKLLGLTAQSPSSTLQQDFVILVGKDQARSGQDAEKHVTDKEISWGHRHGLKQFGKACAKCNEVPFDMKPSNCSVCGDFR